LIVMLGVVMIPPLASGRRAPTLAGCVCGAPAVMLIAWASAHLWRRLGRDGVRRNMEAMYGVTVRDP
jgi:hypothetical protein